MNEATPAAHKIACLAETEPYELSEALLIYMQKGTGRAYATQHKIDTPPNGQAVILAGSPLTRQRLQMWTRALNQEPELELIPETILARNSDALVWWTPAQTRDLYFNLDKETRSGLKTLGRKVVRSVPCPAHVLAATNDTLYAFALETSARPTSATTLLRSPILNIHGDGRLCWGTVRHPSISEPSAIADFEAAVFDAWNTHPNDDQKDIGGGLVALWDRLATEKVPAFPTDLLPPHKLAAQAKPLTLGDLVSLLRR